MIFAAICGPPSGRATPSLREAHKWHSVTVTGRRSTYISGQTVQTNPAGSGVGEHGVMAFTDDGIENLKQLVEIHKDAPWIIEQRRQTFAAMMKPEAEKPDEA